MTSPVPTGRAAAVVAVAAVVVAATVAAVGLDTWATVAVVVVTLVLVGVVDVLRAVAPAEIEVERSFPARLSVGDASELSWLVTNRSDRPTDVTVTDALWPSFGASRRSSTFHLDARRRHRFTATIAPSRRGRFPLDALTVRTTGPLGLVHRQQTRTLADSLAVLPAYPSRELMSRRMRIPLESGLRSVRQRGTGTDFDQLREYRPGDDIRRIDWAGTARRRTAIVREYRTERNQNVVSLLDNGRIMAGSVAGVPRVEHAMDAVLGLSQVAGRLGDNVGLVTFDRQVRGIVPAADGRSQFSRIAEAMYLLDTSYAESAYRTAFTTAASRFRRRSLFVVHTDLAQGVVVDSLLPAVRSLTRTHLVMVAAVRDPDLVDWATGSGTSAAMSESDVAYRAAAASASLSARELAVARLSAAGVVVVDARPGELATAVVDRYLELKASGRL